MRFFGQQLRKVIAVLMLISSVPAIASQKLNDAKMISGNPLHARIKRELSKRLPDARLELIGDVRWVSEFGSDVISDLRILEDTAKGDVHFTVNESEGEGWISFSAWTPAWVAIKRVFPGQKLSSEMFVLQDVNVASGTAREYRGVLLRKDQELTSLEAKQTVLEGQYALSTAVQRVPDVRKGESVRIQLLSGEVVLNTAGTAEETAYLDGTVRVMIAKTKRQLVGKLRSGGVVEVQL